MRHRIKKTYSVQKDTARHTDDSIVSKLRADKQQLNKTSHLLHSDKCTYFYKHKLGSNSMIKTIPLVLSSLVLLMVLGGFVFPSVSNTTSAMTNENTTGVPSARAGGMSVKLTMDSPDVAVLTTQAETGKVSYISKGFTVAASNVDGYAVYVQTAPGANNKLKNGNIMVDFVKADTPTSAFEDNTWGFAIDSTGQTAANLKYNPVPDSNVTNLNPAYSSSSTNETKKFTLNFAAKFAKDATAGHYGTDILLSVAAGVNEVVLIEEPTGFTGGATTIYNMQDMTPQVCTDATEGESGRLRDTRDKKIYWVTKLKDGNCWMTQNLALDLWDEKSNRGVELTEEDSNLTEEQITGATKSGQTINSTTTLSWVSTTGPSGTWTDQVLEKALYYNPGMYVSTSPTAGLGCSGKLTEGGLKDCAAQGWKNVAGMPSSNDPNMTEVFTSSAENIYNAHYLTGNYYTKEAAYVYGPIETCVDEDNHECTPEEVSVSYGDVCPKGWHIPVSDNDFGKLFALYGAHQDGEPIYGSQDVRLSPLYFGYNGRVSDGSILVGASMRFWPFDNKKLMTTPAVGEPLVIRLGGSAGFDFSFQDNKAIYVRSSVNYELPVRCVAR